MSLKRKSSTTFPTTPLSTSKRHHLSSPIKGSKGSPVTPCSYPYIPFTSKPYPPRPSDSPSNPFGRTRKIKLRNSLPKPTAFRRHIPLRFQFIRPGAPRDKDGVFRIAQVPQSYTFKHLRYLICFLFGGQLQTDVDLNSTGFLFEVKRPIQRYSPKYLVGGIRTGETIVRLSNSKDPYLYKDEWELDFSDDEDEEEKQRVEDEEETIKWQWQAEDEFLLSSAWESVDSTETGVVYHQFLPAGKPVQVHISLWDGEIPRRKGHSNAPFVFEARGRVKICPIPQADSDDDDEPEDIRAAMDVDLWNMPHNAFENYIKESAVIPFSTTFDDSDTETEDNTSTPSLTMSSEASYLDQSSVLSSPTKNTLSALQLFSESGSDPISPRSVPQPEYAVPKFTPAPGPANRKRIDYVQRRITRLKRKSLEVMYGDEPDEEPETGEVDQLTEDPVVSSPMNPSDNALVHREKPDFWDKSFIKRFGR